MYLYVSGFKAVREIEHSLTSNINKLCLKRKQSNALADWLNKLFQRELLRTGLLGADHGWKEKLIHLRKTKPSEGDIG